MKTSIALAAVMAIMFVSAPGNTKEFYDGGTLHSATVAEWHNATPENRLATASDFTVAIIGEKKIKKLGSMKAVKTLATDMVTCIDTGTKDIPEVQQQKVADMAAVCAVLMEWK